MWNLWFFSDQKLCLDSFDAMLYDYIEQYNDFHIATKQGQFIFDNYYMEVWYYIQDYCISHALKQAKKRGKAVTIDDYETWMIPIVEERPRFIFHGYYRNL